MNHNMAAVQISDAVRKYSNYAKRNELAAVAKHLHSEGDEQKYTALLLMKMLENEDPDVQSLLGDCYYQGTGVYKNLDKAVSMFRSASNKGSTRADYDLAWYYYDTKDYVRAIEHFKRCIAPESGLDDGTVGRSHRCMANAYANMPNADMQQAVNHWVIASEKYQDSFASKKLALWYFEKDSDHFDATKSLYYFRKAADQGDTYAIDRLARFYIWGESSIGISKDHAEAERILLPHKDLGDADILRSLGLIYRMGEGVRKDYELSRMYLEASWAINDAAITAADLGYVCFLLNDYSAAEKMLKIADSRGSTFFSDFLGRIYKDGLSGRKDLYLASQYYESAYRAGNLNNVFTCDEYAQLLLDTGNFEHAYDVADQGEKEFNDICFVYIKASLVMGGKVRNKMSLDRAAEMLEACIRYNEHKAESYMALGEYYLQAREYRKAEGIYIEAFNDGIVDAAVCLGRMHEQGGGSIKADANCAYDWYSKAAAAGSRIGKLETECFKKGMFSGYKRFKNV